MKSSFDPFQFTANCLATESEEARERVSRAIREEIVDWPRVCRVSSAHLVTPALATGLRMLSLWEELPGELKVYLSTVRQLNRDRNQAILEEASSVISRLNALSLHPVMLKGTAHLLRGLYPDPGDRVVSDIDLLLNGTDAKQAWQALRGAQYQTQEEEFSIPGTESGHHLRPLVGPGSLVRIEIHHCLSTVRGWPAFLQGPALFETARRLPLPGLDARELSLERQIIYNIFHAAVHHQFIFPRSSLRHLRDLSLLSRQDQPINWQRIESNCETSTHGRSCSRYVSACNRLFSNQPIPWSAAPDKTRSPAPRRLSRYSSIRGLQIAALLTIQNLQNYLLSCRPAAGEFLSAVWARLSSRAWLVQRWQRVRELTDQSAPDVDWDDPTGPNRRE